MDALSKHVHTGPNTGHNHPKIEKRGFRFRHGRDDKPGRCLHRRSRGGDTEREGEREMEWRAGRGELSREGVQRMREGDRERGRGSRDQDRDGNTGRCLPSLNIESSNFDFFGLRIRKHTNIKGKTESEYHNIK